MSVIQSSNYNDNIRNLQYYICNCAVMYNGNDMEALGECIFCLQKMQTSKDVNTLQHYIRRFIMSLNDIVTNDVDYFYLVNTLCENEKEYQRTELLMHEHNKNVFGEPLE